MTACGTLEADTEVTITLETTTVLGANVVATIFIGFSEINAPFLGGTLVPAPDIMIAGIPMDTSQGPVSLLPLKATWPSGVPSGTQVFLQSWVTVDWVLGGGLLASNGLSLTAP